MAQITLNIQGMSCDHCKRAVEGALKQLDGVETAEVDLQAHTATVAYDETKVSSETMQRAVEEEGYDVVS